MKKLVFASVMAMASICLVSAPTLRAQDTGTITIKDPAEFAAYTQATTQSDPKAKAAAIESFLQTYPQSVVKTDMLNMLVDTYQQAGDVPNSLKSAKALLQVDPNNLKALFISVAIEKGQCQKGVDGNGNLTDPQPCDDAAALAQKGLVATKPTAVSDTDWKAQTTAAYPVFDSSIALDDALSKKDFKATAAEYKVELALLPDAQTQSGMGLVDTLHLADSYAASVPADPINAVWFYARAWDFAPAAYQGPIEKKLDYWYNKYHGGLDGLDAVKAQAKATLLPPATYTITPAPTPAEKIHKILVSTPDLNTLALADKELVLTYGAKEDADKLWALLKDQQTQVPGVVTDGSASVIKVAVTDDAKQANVADFVVNLKAPLADKEIPAVKSEYGLSSKGQSELDGTYDSYSVIKDADGNPSSVQIVLRDGTVVAKKAAPVHRAAPVHHAAH